MHVALLRTLVRDIEEAAQAVSGGMVGQRDAIAMAAGGHPQLVEAVSSCLIDLVMYHRYSSVLVQTCMFLSWKLTMDDVCVQAFAWGFDIREWGKHVNPLTWPEILRQFALAAGFGPKWKTRKITTQDRSKESPTEVDSSHYVQECFLSGFAINRMK